MKIVVIVALLALLVLIARLVQLGSFTGWLQDVIGAI